jgi:hypothetical protein
MALPHERIRWVVPAIALCLFVMALFLAFLTESLRADQLTLSFEIGGLPVGDIEIAHNHGRLVRDSTLLTLLGLTVAVLWLLWQYRAHANLRALVRGTRFHPVVGVAVWFIPVVNLVGPPLAMRELWRGSHPERDDWRRTWTTPLLWLWWLLLLADLALAWWALAPAWVSNPTLEQLSTRDHRGVIAAGVGILVALVAAGFMILLSQRVALREDLVRMGKWRGWADGRSQRR